MDDKTFMAKFVAEESRRMNQRMKDMLARGEKPSEEEQAELVKDMQESFARLQQTLTHIQQIVDAEQAEEEEKA